MVVTDWLLSFGIPIDFAAPEFHREVMENADAIGSMADFDRAGGILSSAHRSEEIGHMVAAVVERCFVVPWLAAKEFHVTAFESSA